MKLSKKWSNVQRRLSRAISRGKAEGVDLVYGTFGSYEPGKACCALSMVVGEDDPEGDTIGFACRKLDITPVQAWNIVAGFDGKSLASPTEAYEVGVRLRDKFHPRSVS